MTGLSTATMLLMLSPMAHAFLRPIGPVAVSRARWSKVNSASQGTLKAALESEEDKCMYAIGADLGARSDQLHYKRLFNVEERKIGLQGFSDHWLDSGMQLNHSQYAAKLNNILRARNEELARKMAANPVDSVEDACRPEGAVKTASGQIIVFIDCEMVDERMKEGAGAEPLPTDTVTTSPSLPQVVRFKTTQLDKQTGRLVQKGTTRMALESEEDKCIYALGMVLAIRHDRFKKLFDVEERQTVLQGFGDHWLDSEMQLEYSQYQQEMNSILKARLGVMYESMALKGADFLEDAAKAEGAVKTNSGMVIQTIKEGTGAHPLPNDFLKVHYHGTLMDGMVFDSSVMRDSPTRFLLKDVIEGWMEGIQLMKVGGKSKMTIPPQLAYGEKSVGPVPANSTLVFEVELLEIEARAPC